MIDCGNNKYMFTNKKNLQFLVEFANKFTLKIHYAKTAQENIISMEKVAKSFCDQNYVSPTDYKIIKKNVCLKNDSRENITKKAKQIREKIFNLLLKKKKITFKQIQEKFESENISTSALSNHFTHVRHQLSIKGYKILKIKNGVYELQPVSRSKS
jgi:hypothetical protein